MSLCTLISNNKFDEVFQKLYGMLLDEETKNQVVLLSSRHNQNEKSNNSYVISAENYNLERSRITQSLLTIISENNLDGNENPVQNFETKPDNIMKSELELLIQKIDSAIVENKRSQFGVKLNALNIRINEYKTNSLASALFDQTGRRLAVLRNELQEILKEISDVKADSLERHLEKINELLSDPIPSWDNLESAYKLSSKFKFSDEWIANQLQLKMDDDEIKIEIAEKIESGIARRI